MRSSTVLASVLFGSLALAAPVDKRAYATKTEIVVETVVITTTVWDGQVPDATSAPGLFFEEKPTATEKPASASATTSAYVEPTTTSTSTPAPVPTTTSSTSSSSTSVTSTYTPPAPTTITTEPAPKPTTTSTYEAPPPSTTTAAAAAAAPSTTAPSTGSGDEHTGSYTMNYYGGGLGACGEPVSDSEMYVALGVDLFGTATVDYMTGKTTNKWCGKKIAITNNGVTAIATIMDRCPGCTGDGLDATPALWEKTTGGLGGASGDRIYSMTWKVVE